MRRRLPARRGPLVGLFVLACVLGLAGCSGADPAPPDPTTWHPGTAATASTATPTGNPTGIAAAAAIAAVLRWKDGFNLSLRARTSVEYRKTFTKECRICLSDAGVTDRIHKSGEEIVGGAFHLSRLTVVWNKPELVIVQGLLSTDPLTVRQGRRVVDSDAGLKPSSFTWKLKPVSGHWLVCAVDALK